jgi:hypothetical protein
LDLQLRRLVPPNTVTRCAARQPWSPPLAASANPSPVRGLSRGWGPAKLPRTGSRPRTPRAPRDGSQVVDREGPDTGGRGGSLARCRVSVDVGQAGKRVDEQLVQNRPSRAVRNRRILRAGRPADGEGTEVERVRVNRRAPGRPEAIEQAPLRQRGHGERMHDVRGWCRSGTSPGRRRGLGIPCGPAGCWFEQLGDSKSLRLPRKTYPCWLPRSRSPWPMRTSSGSAQGSQRATGAPRPLIEPHWCQREPNASSNSESIAAQERRSAAAL